MRTGLSTQAWAIIPAAASVAGAGTLLQILLGAIIGVRTRGMLMVVKLMPWSANPLLAQRVRASSAALLATSAMPTGWLNTWAAAPAPSAPSSRPWG